MKEYGVFGPLTIPRTRRGGIDDDKLRDFWQQVEEKFAPGLKKASGCYIFGTRAGKGATPWYVGKATKSFEKECFTDRNLRNYDKVLDERKGTPILYLLARRTPGGKFQRELRDQEARKLENFLIDHCLSANGKLLNKQGTDFVRNTQIPGLLNSPPGPHSKEAKSLRRLLNLG